MIFNALLCTALIVFFINCEDSIKNIGRKIRRGRTPECIELKNRNTIDHSHSENTVIIKKVIIQNRFRICFIPRQAI